jgi:outer membrane protein assembly factor BamB
MSIFAHFMTQLLPIINHQFNWPIWRMEVDEISSTLFVELRNSEEKKVAFGSVNLITSNINFTNITTPERWLTGIEAAYDGVLLVHNYQSETGPVHKGLIAIDAITGQSLWSNYTLAFDHLSVNGPIVYNAQIQPPKLFLADIKTGQTKRSYEPVIDTGLNNNIISPQLIPADFLKELTLPVIPYANTAHFMEHNTFRIVSLHTFFQEQLKQHLYIINSEGTVVYQDLLNSDIQKLQPEAFVVHKNSLIYLKNRSELIVLNL